MARKSFLLLAILGIVAPLTASAPLVKKAQAAGFADVKNCQACHVDKMPKKDSHELADMGKFLMAEKAKRKAAEVDVAWLKDYKAKK